MTRLDVAQQVPRDRSITPPVAARVRIAAGEVARRLHGARRRFWVAHGLARVLRVIHPKVAAAARAASSADGSWECRGRARILGSSARRG
jgi:hypothetical protein